MKGLLFLIWMFLLETATAQWGGRGRGRGFQKPKPPKSRDFYKILGVKRGADAKEIKKAYRSLAKEWHPDMHVGSDKEENANDVFVEINSAYEVLSDPELKKKYDQCGEECLKDDGNGGGNQQGGDFVTVMMNGRMVRMPRSMFNQGGGGGKPRQEPNLFENSHYITEVSPQDIKGEVKGVEHAGEDAIREEWPSVLWVYYGDDDKQTVDRAASRFTMGSIHAIKFMAVNCKRQQYTQFCNQNFKTRGKNMAFMASIGTGGHVKYDPIQGHLEQGILKTVTSEPFIARGSELSTQADLEKWLKKGGTKPKIFLVYSGGNTQKVTLAKRIYNYPHGDYAYAHTRNFQKLFKHFFGQLPKGSLSAFHIYNPKVTDMKLLKEASEPLAIKSYEYDQFTKAVRTAAEQKLNKKGKYAAEDKLVELTADIQKKGFCGAKESATCFVLIHNGEESDMVPPIVQTKKLDELRKQYSGERAAKFATLINTPEIQELFGTKFLIDSNAALVALKPKLKLWKQMAPDATMGEFVHNVINNEGLRLNGDNVMRLKTAFAIPPAGPYAAGSKPSAHDEL